MRFPMYPDYVYENAGWVDWTAFLEGYRNPRNTRSLDECKARVRELELATRIQYRAACKRGDLEGFPRNPHSVYGVSWAEILGKQPRSSWPTLAALQRRLNALGISLQREYLDAYLQGKLSGYPRDPMVAYKVPWAVIARKRRRGTEWPPLKQLKETLARLKIATSEQYRTAWKQGKLKGYPGNPLGVYGDKWAVILGKRAVGLAWPPLSQLQSTMKRLKVSTSAHYKRAHHEGHLSEFPLSPHAVYNVRWSVILGKRSRGAPSTSIDNSP